MVPMNDVPEEIADQRTGVASVDRVLDLLGELEDLPVEEHMAVFERAHDGLRRALDGAGEAGSPVPAALRPQH